MSSDVTVSTLNVVRWGESPHQADSSGYIKKDSNWEKAADILLTLPRVLFGGKTYKLISTKDTHLEKVEIDNAPDSGGVKFLKLVFIILGLSVVVPLIGYGIKKCLFNDRSCFTKHAKVKHYNDELVKDASRRADCKDGGILTSIIVGCLCFIGCSLLCSKGQGRGY